MSSYMISLKSQPFSIEKTESFLNDLDTACKTMQSESFINLFKKYDWYENEDYKEILEVILKKIETWSNPLLGSKILTVTQFEANCIYCSIGKKVTGYKWRFKNSSMSPPHNETVFLGKMAFNFEYTDNQLVEFGVCNAYVDTNDLEILD